MAQMRTGHTDRTLTAKWMGGGRCSTLAVAVAAGVLNVAGCGSSPAPSPSGSGQATPTSSSACAWPLEVNFEMDNRDLPDTAAYYSAQPFTIGKDTRVSVSGAFPDARYAAFSVYTSGGGSFTANGVGTSLADYQIVPDSGSLNPWRQPAAPGGRFTITLRSDASPGQVNVLPLAPAGTAGGLGYLVYRVYLPAGGDFSKVALPTVALTVNGSSQALPACATHTMALPSPGAASPAAQSTTSGASVAPPGPLQFYRPALKSIDYFANADSAYLEAYLAPPAPSDVVVITAKAPTFASGDHPSVWPASGEQLRYWSMCVGLGVAGEPVVVNHLPGGQTDPGCRADEATRLSPSADFTYVIGSEAQRPAIERIPGVTFLPLSSAQPTALLVLLFRNTLANPTFSNSGQNVSQTGNAAAAAAVMGPYYPRARKCALSVLTSSGPQGCPQAP
jgi:hypothetical protein